MMNTDGPFGPTDEHGEFDNAKGTP